jgi:PGF-CTERM protein
VAAFVFGVALAVGLAAGGGTVAAQTEPNCSTVGFTQNASGYYEVTNVSQLQCVGNSDSGVALDDDYVQTSDIDAMETRLWNGGNGFQPISASADGDFTGTFDGNGFQIDALTINRAGEDETGLFAAAGTGAIVTNVTLNGIDVTGNDGTGGLVGNNAGEVRGASVGGTVTGARTVGGLVGENDGDVSDATSSADVTGDLFVGGLVGLSSGPVTNATATGNVEGADNYVGGLIGDSRAGVNDSMARGDVTGGDFVGGLIGINTAAVNDSMASGDVTGDFDVGGLIGETAAPVSNAKATGNVDGLDKVGGLIGDNGGSVTGSTANGTVTGEDEVGGLIGDSGAPVSNATATGTVDGSGNDVGGLIGANYDDVSDAASSADVTGGRRVGGLVGSNIGGTIDTSNATGNVTASGRRVGGLVGYNDGGFVASTLRESFATGNVTGEDETGGLVGQNRDDVIVDSYALGDVDGDDDVGCLVGNNTGSGSSVETSYAACSVTGSSDVGGLIGTTEDGAGVTDSYWDTDQAGGVGSDGGTGLTTAEMTGEDARGNMTGFDFTSTWFAEQDSYPELSSNTRSSRQPADGGDGSTNETDNESSGAPEITNYDVSADGGEITVSFDSDENLVEITVEITGAETATLDREDFSGDTYSGFNATYDAETDGSYTVELTEARDSSNNDGTEGETFRESVTVDAEDDNGTATPTHNGTATPTPTDEPDTPTATPTDEPDTPTPTPTDGPDSPTTTGPEDTPGFGAVVTVLAVLGAALLAHRRRDGAG